MSQFIRRLWAYVPVPEPHVAGLAVGLALQARRPRRLTRRRRLARATGLVLVSSGLFLIGWALRAVAVTLDTGARRPVTAGPYAVSRNPMYVGWTLLYAGTALLRNDAWVAGFTPAVLATTHWIVRREERELELAFGDEFRAYSGRVRRYL